VRHITLEKQEEEMKEPEKQLVRHQNIQKSHMERKPYAWVLLEGG
jgi:hypothetical protein